MIKQTVANCGIYILSSNFHTETSILEVHCIADVTGAAEDCENPKTPQLLFTSQTLPVSTLKHNSILRSL